MLQKFEEMERVAAADRQAEEERRKDAAEELRKAQEATMVVSVPDAHFHEPYIGCNNMASYVLLMSLEALCIQRFCNTKICILT